MARRIALAFILVLFLAWAGWRYIRYREDAALAAQWLARNCTLTERAKLEPQIQERGAALESRFIEAFSRGPQSSDLRALRAIVRSTYERQQDRLKNGETFGLSSEDVAALKKESEAEEQQQEADDFDIGYRAAALNALAVIGRPAGEQLLTRIANDKTSPFQGIAQRTLVPLGRPQ